MRGPGWVPADVPGMLLSWFQVAAASWDRAELAVQTNTTRGARWKPLGVGGGGEDEGMVGAQLDVAAAPVPFGPDPPDDAGVLEDPQVVGQQVAAQPDVGAELAG